MKNRIIALAVVFVMLFAAPCYAEAPKIKLDNAAAKPGETVEIPITLSGNTGFNSLGIEIDYNSDVMTLTAVDANSAAGGMYMSSEKLSTKPYNLSWTEFMKSNTYNGVIATLTFKISDNASAGEYPVTVDYYKGRNGNFVDGVDVNINNGAAVGFTYESSQLTVEEILLPPTQSLSDNIEISDIVCNKFRVKVTNPNPDGKIIAASYDNNNVMLEVNMYDEKEIVDVEFENPGAVMKIMSWNVENITPLSNSKSIQIPCAD